MAPISTAQRSTCTAIWRSLISVTTTALLWGVDDTGRADELAEGIYGKRLTCRRPNPKDIPLLGEARPALEAQAGETKTKIRQILANKVREARGGKDA